MDSLPTITTVENALEALRYSRDWEGIPVFQQKILRNALTNPQLAWAASTAVVGLELWIPHRILGQYFLTYPIGITCFFANLLRYIDQKIVNQEVTKQYIQKKVLHGLTPQVLASHYTTYRDQLEAILEAQDAYIHNYEEQVESRKDFVESTQKTAASVRLHVYKVQRQIVAETLKDIAKRFISFQAKQASQQASRC